MKVKTVLVIDDNKRTRDSLKMFFEQENFIVRCCADMTSACDGLRQVYFDLVLIDYHLQEMNGAEITRMMRNFCQEPLIVGMSLENKEREFLEAGANAFIGKDRLIQGLTSLIDDWSERVKNDTVMPAKRLWTNGPQNRSLDHESVTRNIMNDTKP